MTAAGQPQFLHSKNIKQQTSSTVLWQL